MRLSEGVEWAVHACVLLAALPPGRALTGAALAEFLGVPPAYLAKHLQALSRAGLVETTRGAAGGYRLARAPDAINLHDFTIAIEGRESAFRCQEVRQRGPVGAPREQCKRPCGIAASFYAAERAWQAELAKVTLSDLRGTIEPDADRIAKMTAWLADNLR